MSTFHAPCLGLYTYIHNAIYVYVLRTISVETRSTDMAQRTIPT